MACTLFGSGEIVLADKTNPKMFQRTYWTHTLVCSVLHPSRRIFQKLHEELHHNYSAWATTTCRTRQVYLEQISWKISLAAFVPKLNLAYRRRPLCVANVVMYGLSGASGIWWYPDQRSCFENTVAPLRMLIRWSTVGVGCLSRLIALFAILISTYNLTSPLFLGTIH